MTDDQQLKTDNIFALKFYRFPTKLMKFLQQQQQLTDLRDDEEDLVV